ncbi:hypothetical protein [Micromonospora sp. WMMD998]|uniref:hypothetical protein n=1 Tax=Micromonospora sp. WMMD998 TaxID=3016092 RepID=UPI002499D0EA|nr:hypothetical protein [Micromonospora sp. WMMD998]WFE41915.1 hypothetical protein O7619_27105 [Micromonospora sp. WMMD998]
MIALAGVLILAGLAVLGWLVWLFATAPTFPDPDEQLVAAALTPDAALFTEDEQRAIAAAHSLDVSDAELAADVERFLTEMFPEIRPVTPEDS